MGPVLVSVVDPGLGGSGSLTLPRSNPVLAGGYARNLLAPSARTVSNAPEVFLHPRRKLYVSQLFERRLIFYANEERSWRSNALSPQLSYPQQLTQKVFLLCLSTIASACGLLLGMNPASLLLLRPTMTRSYARLQLVRSDSPKRRRTDDADNVQPEQSVSQLGSETPLALN
jgi:hypothetical protein